MRRTNYETSCMIDLSNFKEVKDTKGKYLVDIKGRVFSKYVNRLLRELTDAYGYRYYNLMVNGKKSNVKKHRIVMCYFGSDMPHDKTCVNHIDGDKANNDLSNLEWCNHSENMIHSIRVLGNPKPPSPQGKTGEKSKLSRPVKSTNIKTGEVCLYAGARDAERINNGEFKQSSINMCANGVYKQYKGFNWEYI